MDLMNIKSIEIFEEEQSKPEPAVTMLVFKCPTCSEKFADIKSLRNHKENECAYIPDSPKKSPAVKTKKSIPDQIFKKLNNETTISKVNLSKKCFWSCDMCPQVFGSEKRLKDHQENHDNNIFIKRKNIVVWPNKNSSLTCNKCCIKFLLESQLREHEKQHLENKEPEYKCVVCNREFYNSDRLSHHQINAHRAEVKVKKVPEKGKVPAKRVAQKFLCDTCGKEFGNNYRLQRHIGMHLGIKKLNCSFCGRGFAEKDTLARHERIHTGERPYSCEYCGKCFRQDGPFKVHLRTHTGERPYTCNLCGKGFITNQLLKFHTKKCGEDIVCKTTRKKRGVKMEIIYVKPEVEDVDIKESFC